MILDRNDVLSQNHQKYLLSLYKGRQSHCLTQPVVSLKEGTHSIIERAELLSDFLSLAPLASSS